MIREAKIGEKERAHKWRHDDSQSDGVVPVVSIQQTGLALIESMPLYMGHDPASLHSGAQKAPETPSIWTAFKVGDGEVSRLAYDMLVVMMKMVNQPISLLKLYAHFTREHAIFHGQVNEWRSVVLF